MAYTWATFKNAVKVMVSGGTISDDTAVRAIADFVKAHAARDLTKDQSAYVTLRQSYLEQFRALLGYTVTLDTATLQSRVRELITDGTIDDTTALLVVVDFVKSRIALEVDKDPDLHNSYLSKYLQGKARLLGYTITQNAADLRTNINPLITVDADRAGISEGGGYIDQLIEQARADIAGLATWVDKHIDQGRIEMAGSSELINGFIHQAVLDVQHFVEFYRHGHETTYTVDDLNEDGATSVGTKPEGSNILDAYYVSQEDETIRSPLVPYDWQNRFDLVAGVPKLKGQGYITIDPQGSELMVFPKVLEGYQLEVFYDARKTDFEDDDTVPFDEPMVKAVSDYVLAETFKRAPLRDLVASALHSQDYQRKRLELYRSAKEKVTLRFRNVSPAIARGCALAEMSESDSSGDDSITTDDTQMDCFDIGDGESTTITVEHNFGTTDVSVEIYEPGDDGKTVVASVTRPTEDTVELQFVEAPGVNQYRVCITAD